MKTKIFNLILPVMLAMTLSCDNIEIDYGGRDNCSDGRLITAEFTMDQAGMATYIPDKTEILDYYNLQAGQVFSGACNGDSVRVTFTSEISKDAPRPVFVGCFIWYDYEITPLTVNWNGNGQFDQYSGSGSALAPKDYDDGSFQVIFEFSFLKDTVYFDPYEYLRSVFVSLKATAEYYTLE